MSIILYYLILKPLSWLPLRLTYPLSSLLSFVVFRVFGYRTKVVLENLRNSFPDKSEAEIQQIARKFYRHFGDIVVESIHLFSISREEANRRFKYTNPELVQGLYEQGRDIAIVGGHVNNWELFAVTVPQNSDHRATAIYKPLSNAFLNKKLQESRERFGLEMYSTRDRMEIFEGIKEPKLIVFGSDQSPSNAKNAYWMDFLNQDTPVPYGCEKYAKDYNIAVVFGNIQKIKRGYYQTTYEVVELDPGPTVYGAITEGFTKKIEAQIIENPDQWLWTHRRWKRKREGIILGPTPPPPMPDSQKK